MANFKEQNAYLPFWGVYGSPGSKVLVDTTQPRRLNGQGLPVSVREQRALTNEITRAAYPLLTRLVLPGEPSC